jgi:N-acetylglucosaminyldiphosphoundecaprenol N-acetyl-beta-D-mannosaminyltransferase
MAFPEKSRDGVCIPMSSPTSVEHRHLNPPARPWPRSRLLNVWVDNLNINELLHVLDQGVVFTLNPDHIYHLQRNRAFYEAYRQADFITSDSKYVYWGLKWIGRRIQEKCSGSDVVPAFCIHNAGNPRVKVFYLGAAPGIAEQAMRRTNEQAGAQIAVGALSPSMRFVEDQEEIAAAIRTINASGASVLIVGLGAPKQEIWIQKYKHMMPGVRVFMGVGATIDYQAGAVRRAPPWMTRNGLEWAYRLATEPRRYWRRYWRDMEYFWLLIMDGFGLYRDPMLSRAAVVRSKSTGDLS